ncbi:AMP-binding protein, partial [Pseudotabrizicola sp.]|uniref:AMP-binding protein n=1 Tax=Pseudotabrizicola sp. TaxID=2939647 RepID=UPI002726A547
NWKMSRIDALRPEKLHGWMERQQVTRALIPPALCERLARSGAPPLLHTVFTGGGPVFPDLIERLKTVAPSVGLTCVYGSTEAEPIAHLNTVDIDATDQAAMEQGHGLLVGRPVDDIRLRIKDDEVQVAGDHVNSGYLDPAHDRENKIHEGDTVWHRTGDAGHLDAKGRLWLLGRIGAEVQIAGQRVHPFSVEVAVRKWPGVRSCALIANGQQVSLFIEGDTHEASLWGQQAAALGIERVIPIAKMPMDKRHASKIDRAALMES